MSEEVFESKISKKMLITLAIIGLGIIVMVIRLLTSSATTTATPTTATTTAPPVNKTITTTTTPQAQVRLLNKSLICSYSECKWYIFLTVNGTAMVGGYTYKDATVRLPMDFGYQCVEVYTPSLVKFCDYFPYEPPRVVIRSIDWRFGKTAYAYITLYNPGYATLSAQLYCISCQISPSYIYLPPLSATVVVLTPYGKARIVFTNGTAVNITAPPMPTFHITSIRYIEREVSTSVSNIAWRLGLTGYYAGQGVAVYRQYYIQFDRPDVDYPDVVSAYDYTYKQLSCAGMQCTVEMLYSFRPALNYTAARVVNGTMYFPQRLVLSNGTTVELTFLTSNTRKP